MRVRIPSPDWPFLLLAGAMLSCNVAGLVWYTIVLIEVAQ